jgi:hypothetical protein
MERSKEDTSMSTTRPDDRVPQSQPPCADHLAPEGLRDVACSTLTEDPPPERGLHDHAPTLACSDGEVAQLAPLVPRVHDGIVCGRGGCLAMERISYRCPGRDHACNEPLR